MVDNHIQTCKIIYLILFVTTFVDLIKMFTFLIVYVGHIITLVEFHNYYKYAYYMEWVKCPISTQLVPILFLLLFFFFFFFFFLFLFFFFFLFILLLPFCNIEKQLGCGKVLRRICV